MMEGVPSRTDRDERTERSDRPEPTEPTEPTEGTEGTGRSDRTERTERSDRTERTGRAAPMSRDDRRDALVDVFVELAHREGRKPTTSEIAQEAGVAEGTIFRVFATKEALEREAVQAAFCPAPVRRRIAAIDPEGTLRERLVDFTRIMQARFTEVFGLMAALGLTEPPNRGPHLACYEAGRHLRGPAPTTRTSTPPPTSRCSTSIHELLVHDEDHLVVPATDLVHRLRLLTFSGSHPGIADGQVLTPEEIVDTVLFGLVCRPRTTESGLGIAELYAQLGGDPEALADPLPEPDGIRPRRGAGVTNQLTLTPRESLASHSVHPTKGALMLMRLLRTHLRPYRGQIVLIVLAQFVSTMASLYLPSLNGQIIDQGSPRATPPTSSATARSCSPSASCRSSRRSRRPTSSAKVAMGMGRDIRGNVFGTVVGFSAQEVTRFGAPTLISRNTNDVTQVQMVAFMAFALLVTTPIMMVGGIIMALREDVGLSWLVAVAVPLLGLCVGLVISRMVPWFGRMQTSLDGVNRVMREQITGIRVVRAFVREEHEEARFAEANGAAHQRRPAGRAADGPRLPDRHAHLQPLDGRRHVVRRAPHRLRRHADRRADGVPVLPRPDPHGRHDGDLHGDDDPSRVGLRRSSPGGPRHRVDRRRAVAARCRCPWARPGSPSPASTSTTPGPRPRCCTT